MILERKGEEVKLHMVVPSKHSPKTVNPHYPQKNKRSSNQTKANERGEIFHLVHSFNF